MKHTPGPWTAFNQHGILAVIKDGTKREVVHWSGFDSCSFEKQAIANAHLIAAAPELLTMLETLVDAITENCLSCEQELTSEIVEARALIQKATGNE